MDASDEISAKIAGLSDWRGATLARVRALIHRADPEVVETVKWRKPTNPAGVPVWEHAGIICTGDAFKHHVKVTFGKGAKLPDPQGVFNAGLAGASFRAVDLREGEWVDEEAFIALFRAAVALNLGRA
jgi:hypothetical protein